VISLRRVIRKKGRSLSPAAASFIEALKAAAQATLVDTSGVF
jgi:hypothetical protein